MLHFSLFVLTVVCITSLTAGQLDEWFNGIEDEFLGSLHSSHGIDSWMDASTSEVPRHLINVLGGSPTTSPTSRPTKTPVLWTVVTPSTGYILTKYYSGSGCGGTYWSQASPVGIWSQASPVGYCKAATVGTAVSSYSMTAWCNDGVTLVVQSSSYASGTCSGTPSSTSQNGLKAGSCSQEKYVSLVTGALPTYPTGLTLMNYEDSTCSSPPVWNIWLPTGTCFQLSANVYAIATCSATQGTLQYYNTSSCDTSILETLNRSSQCSRLQTGSDDDHDDDSNDDDSFSPPGTYQSMTCGSASLAATSPTNTPTNAAMPTPAPEAAMLSVPTKAPVAAVPTTPVPSIKPTAQSSSCFAGSETVMLASGEVVSISQAQIGDRVLAADANGKLVFSEVVFVPHEPNSQRTKFTQLRTLSGRDIRLTADHLLLAGACGATAAVAGAGHAFSMIQASQVVVGACLLTVDGEEAVVRTEVVESLGIYTLVTREPLLVVNGIVASPFSGNHAVTDAFYNVHRTVYGFAPWLLRMGWLKTANLLFGEIVMAFSA